MSDDFGVCITNRPRVPLVTHRLVVAHHDGLLVVSWPPQYHDTDDVWLSERAPENVAKHEEMMR